MATYRDPILMGAVGVQCPICASYSGCTMSDPHPSFDSTEFCLTCPECNVLSNSSATATRDRDRNYANLK